MDGFKIIQHAKSIYPKSVTLPRLLRPFWVVQWGYYSKGTDKNAPSKNMHTAIKDRYR